MQRGALRTVRLLTIDAISQTLLQVGLGVALGSFIALLIKWFVTWCR